MTEIILADEMAERSVIGCMIIDNRLIPQILNAVSAEDFYIPKHRVLFEASKSLNAVGEPTDYVTLTNQLISTGKLERAGGAQYLAGLTNVVASQRNAKNYCAIVRNFSRLRNLKNALMLTAFNIDQGEQDINKLTSNLASAIFEINANLLQAGEPVSVINALRESDEYYRRVEAGEIPPPLTTGFFKLDKSVRLHQGDMFVIGARPSMGKTAFAVEIFLRILKNHPDARGLYLTCEMSPMKIGYRFLSREGGINLTSLIFGEQRNLGDSLQAEYFRQAGSRAKIAELNRGTEQDILLLIQQETIRGEKPDFVVIDYLQNLTYSQRKTSRREEMSALSVSIKNMARGLKIPIIMLSQLNRDAENGRPSMAHLNETGKIEQDADFIVLLHPEGNYDDLKNVPVWDVKIHLDKARDGATGMMQCSYDRSTGTFKELFI